MRLARACIQIRRELNFPGFPLNLHARTLGTTINETVQTAGVESILAIIYTVANGKDRVYFGPAAR